MKDYTSEMVTEYLKDKQADIEKTLIKITQMSYVDRAKDISDILGVRDAYIEVLKRR